MKLKLLLSVLFLYAGSAFAQQGVAYVTDQNGEPWGSQSNVTALNTVFGNGGWTRYYFQNANANTVFSANNCTVWVEGGEAKDVLMNNFVTANQVTIQNWVNNGGHLFANSAGWNTNVNPGFGGVVITLVPQYVYASGTDQISFGQGAHAMFNNGVYPCGTSWTGNYFNHDIITGPGGTGLITATAAQGNQQSLTELNYGCGKVLFGGITASSFHGPQPQADNRCKALIAYMNPCSAVLNCSNYSSPANAATNVSCAGTTLTWQVPIGCPPTGYKLYFGTNNPPTNIVNGVNQGNVLTYNTGALSANTTYYWKIVPTNGQDATGCAVWSFTTGTVPAAPSPISGPTNPCQGSSVTYSVPAVAGATSYTWTVPAGSTITAGQGTTSITVTIGNTPGNVCVSATNGCGTSSQTCIAITINTIPATPGVITGPTNPCSGTSQSYSIAAVPGATSYTWTVPAGTTITAGQGTTNVTVTIGNTSGNICVTATNACGTSAASCLAITVNNIPATPGAITGPTNPCQGSSVNYSIAAVPGATSYTWTVPAGSTITAGQGTTSITVTIGNTAGNVCVTATNACGTSAASCLAITINNIPATPGNITGANNPCQGSSQVYSIAAVPGATSYTWTVPAGSTITAGQGTTSVTVTIGNTPGNICVTATNACGTSAASCLAITINNIPATPGAISGPTNPCSGTSQSYSISAVNGATSYTWTVPAGTTITAGQGTTNVTVTIGNTSGNICVTATNACGTSAASCLAITVNNIPATPGVITGPTNPCSGTSQNYSIAAVPGATSYTWTVPAGSTITAGQGTTAITVTMGNTAGNVCVTATNACGTSAASCLAITINTIPAAPGAITGPLAVCENTTQTYSITAVAGATSYTWTVPAGAVINNGQGTTSVSVTFGNTSGNVCVTATNVCGTSSATCVAVTVSLNPNPANAGPDQQVCGLTATLAGNAANLGTGTWAYVSGPGALSFGNVNSPTSTVTATVAGTYVMSWTIVNGPCSTTDNIQITFSAAVINANAGPDQQVCGLTATLAGNAPNVGTSTWSYVSGPGALVFANPNSPTSTVTASAYGTYTIRWGFVNGTCNSADSVNIRFDQMPNAANAGPDQRLCGSVATLAGNAANVGTGTWAVVSGPGGMTFSNANSPTSTATGAAYGTFVLSWTIVNGTCSTTDNVQIIFDEPLTPANAGPDQALCSSTTVMAGNVPNVGTGTWSMINGPGTLNFSNANSATSNVTANGYGTYTIRWSLVNGVCTSADTVVITFDQMPNAANAGPDQSVCLLNATLAGNAANVGSGTWSMANGPGNINFNNANSPTTAITASAYGLYTLRWTIVNGTCTTRDSMDITFNPLPVLTVSNDTTICYGSATTLTASGAATYTWSPAQGLNQTNGPVVVANPTVSTMYYVTGTTNGCSSTDSVMVNVPAQLTLNAAAFPATCHGACNGQLAVIPNGGTLPYSYLWTPGNYNTGAVANVCAGIYRVQVTDGLGCVDTVSVIVTEPVGMTLATNTTPTTCFAGSDGTASVAVNGGTAPYSYNWTPSGGNAANAANLAAGVYMVHVSDANNCTDSATVTVTEPAQVIVTPSADVTICIGSQTNLSVSAVGGNGTYTYTWNPGNMNGASQQVSPVVTTVYTVIATDGNGCVSPADSVTVTVNPPLSVTASPDISICSGASTNISANATGGDGNYTYTWNNGAGIGQQVQVTPAQTTTYVVTVNDNCGTPVAKDSVVVTVLPLPVVAFTSDKVDGCTPTCVDFTDQSTAAGATITAWAWDFGDGSATSSSQNPTHCYSTPGTYTVTLMVTSSDGCVNTKTQTNMIDIYSLPLADFTMTPPITDMLNPLIRFADKSTAATKWTWNFGDKNNLDATSTLQNPVYTYSDTGMYCVKLRIESSHGCLDSTTHCLVINPAFVLYIPNAFTPDQYGDNETFAPKGMGILSFDMMIFDRWGNLIFRTDDINRGWDGTSKFSSGIAQQDVYVYLIKVTDVQHRNHSYNGSVTLVK